MSDELDPVLRTRLGRLAQAVPVAPERLRPIASASPRYRGRSGVGVLAAAVLVLVLALAAASMGGGPSPSASPSANPTGNTASMTDGTFRMTIHAPKANYAVDEPIEVVATVEYVGTEPSVSLSSTPGMPGFGVQQLDGNHRAVPAHTGSCVSYSFVRGQPVAYPFAKSGGFYPEMPDADFMSRYLNIVDGRADPVLRLPAGTWRIFAEAEFTEGGCGGAAHKLEVGVTIVVAGPVPSSPGEPSSPAPAADWGPLAVVPPQDGTDMARAEGTLRITDTCVHLAVQGEVMLLVWLADRTTWNAEAQTITFRNFDGTVATVGDGDPVVLGGGAYGLEGTSNQEWVASVDWVAPPASSCLRESRFGVGVVGDH